MLFGSTLGGVFAWIGHYQIKPFFYELPNFLYSNENGSKFLVSCREHGIALIFCFILPINFAILMLLYRENDDADFLGDKVWHQNMVNSGCEEPFDPTKYLHHRHFLHSGVIGAVYGTILGQLFEYKVIVNTNVLNVSPWTWHESDPVRALIRVALTFGALLSFGALSYFVEAHDIFDMQHSDVEFAEGYLVGYLLPSFIVSFILFAFGRLFFNRLHLDNANATGLEFESRVEVLRRKGLAPDVKTTGVVDADGNSMD